MRPTKEGPAMIFNSIKGHEGARVAIGLLASRTRVGHLLDCDPKRLGFLLKESVAIQFPRWRFQMNRPSARRSYIWLRNRALISESWYRLHQYSGGCRPLYHPWNVLCLQPGNRGVRRYHSPHVLPVRG